MGEIESDDSGWYAVYTKPQQESRADANLRAWNIETFAPKIREPRYNEFTGRPTYVTKPFFPRYIFARFSAGASLHKVCFVRGVQNVVSFGDGPVPVDAEIIKLIKARVGEDGFVKLGERLAPGDQVAVEEGPVRDLIGIFEREVSAGERVHILLTAAKYQCRLSAPRGLIRKVG
jgi:transcriptional antiterminator RfaH